MKTTRIILLLLYALFPLTNDYLQAGNVWWDGDDGADWFDPGSWFPGIPASGDTVYIDEGRGGPLITQGDAYAGTVYVGFDTTSNTMEQRGLAGSTVTVTELILGYAEGSSGEYSLSGTNQLLAGAVSVGYSGSGEFTQQGGVIEIRGPGNARLYVGRDPLSVGEYYLQGGSVTVQYEVILGYVGGKGIFRQTGGTLTTADRGIIVRGDNSLYELSGSGQITSYNTSVDACYGPDSRFLQNGGTHMISRNLGVYCRGEHGTSYVLRDGELTVARNLLMGLHPSGYCMVMGPGVAVFTHTGGTNTVGGSLHIGRNFECVYELSGNGELSAAEEILGVSVDRHVHTQRGDQHHHRQPHDRLRRQMLWCSSRPWDRAIRVEWNSPALCRRRRDHRQRAWVHFEPRLFRQSRRFRAVWGHAHGPDISLHWLRSRYHRHL